MQGMLFRGYFAAIALASTTLALPAWAQPIPCTSCTLTVAGARVKVTAFSDTLRVDELSLNGVNHLFKQGVNVFDSSGEEVDLFLSSATVNDVTNQIVVRYFDDAGTVDARVVFTFSATSASLTLDEQITITAVGETVSGSIYVVTDYDLGGDPTDASASASHSGLTQMDGDFTGSLRIVSGSNPNSFDLLPCCSLLEDIVGDGLPVVLQNRGTGSAAADFQFAQRWSRSLGPGQSFDVTLRKQVVGPDPLRDDFAAMGGFQRYLADPDNGDLRAAGICDAESAFAHWRDFGRFEGRDFAAGGLRTDRIGHDFDPDYAIDGGFSWEYPGSNTVVFITADAPKPLGWDGRNLLLERCQEFNLGIGYTAQGYRVLNVDVANAVDGGLIPSFASVTDHYVKYGFKEGRLTSPEGWTQMDLDAWNDQAYFAVNPDVEVFFDGAVGEGWRLFGKAGFAHWINFGRHEGRQTGQAGGPGVSAAENLFNQMLRAQYPDGFELTNPPTDMSIQVAGGSGPVQWDFGGGVPGASPPPPTLQLGLQVGSSSNVTGLGVRFGSSGPIYVVPQMQSGSLSASLPLPPSLCDDLSSICHDIKCFEFAVTEIGTVSRANIVDIAAACGNCDEPSCQDLIDECSDCLLAEFCPGFDSGGLCSAEDQCGPALDGCIDGCFFSSNPSCECNCGRSAVNCGSGVFPGGLACYVSVWEDFCL